jgi:hypothetical protein
MRRKFPQLERSPRVARLAERPTAWAYFLEGKRRGRTGGVFAILDRAGSPVRDRAGNFVLNQPR